MMMITTVKKGRLDGVDKLFIVHHSVDNFLSVAQAYALESVEVDTNSGVAFFTPSDENAGSVKAGDVPGLVHLFGVEVDDAAWLPFDIVFLPAAQTHGVGYAFSESKVELGWKGQSGDRIEACQQ